MKQWNKKKRLTAVIALALAAAIAAGILFLSPGGGETVGVYPFERVGMTEYWGDSQESYGPVSTDKIQTVFLTDTQTVTEILVKAGDTVKKGDVLMTFDTTLSGLSLERKRLEVEKQQLQLDIAQQELKKIRIMEPMEIPWYVPADPFLGDIRQEPYELFLVEGNDGTTQEKAVVCWLQEDVKANDLLLEAIRRKVWNNAGVCEHGNLEDACETCDPPRCPHGNPVKDCPFCNVEVCEHDRIKVLCPVCTPVLCRHGKEEAGCPLCNAERCEHDNLKDQCSICDPILVLPTEPATETEPPEETLPPVTAPSVIPTASTGTVRYTLELLAETQEPATEPSVVIPEGCEYYVVFKVTEGNYQLGTTTTWQGVHVSGKGTDFELSLFYPEFEDYSIPDIAPEETQPEFDMGSGYTFEQINQMIKDQEKQIKKLEFDLKMVETEYKIMQTELEDGNVYADIDGEVISVLTEEEARQNRQPVLKVSGGGGFLVEGSVSELEKDKLEIGQEVTINDWNSGQTYTGTIRSLGDFPDSKGYWNGMGNPNTTYYPFTVFVDGSANLQAGSYVSVVYSGAGSENGIYLENPFLRTEQGRSYVYVLGPGSKLERREVVTGKSLWGSYTEILSGLSDTDLIAFPYGKDVKPGAPAEERNISELYS